MPGGSFDLQWSLATDRGALLSGGAEPHPKSFSENEMNRPGRLLPGLAFLALVAVLCVAPCAVAWSAEPAEKPAEKPPQYVGPYVLVMACIGFGVWVVCRPSRREGPKEFTFIASTVNKEEVLDQRKRRGPARREKEVSPEARMGLKISIIGVFVPFVGILGIWKSAQAKKAISQSRRLTGETIALGGIIVGAVAVAIWGIIILVVLMKVLSGG